MGECGRVLHTLQPQKSRSNIRTIRNEIEENAGKTEKWIRFLYTTSIYDPYRQVAQIPASICIEYVLKFHSLF